MILQVARVLYGAPGERLRMTLWASRYGDIVCTKEIRVNRCSPGDSGLKQSRLLEERVDSERAPVATTPDTDSFRIYVGQRRQVIDSALEVVDVPATKVYEELLSKFPTVSGASSYIDLDHDVAAFD